MIILFLYNLAVYSSEGQQAIHDTTRNELLLVLPTIESNLRKHIRKIKKKLIILSRLTTLINLFQQFKSF